MVIVRLLSGYCVVQAGKIITKKRVRRNDTPSRDEKQVLLYQIDILIRGFLLQLKRNWQSEFYAN